MKIALGNDHGGLGLRSAVLETLAKNNIEVLDFGTFTTDSVDYPEYGQKVAEAVASGEADAGVLICTTGIGMSMAANKVKGIRCAVVTNTFTAEMTKRHNNANVISLGAAVVTPDEAKAIVQAYLDAEFEGGRHGRRVDIITAIESKYSK